MRRRPLAKKKTAELDASAKTAADIRSAAAGGGSADGEVNPYSPPVGLDDAELVQYLFDMQDKPQSVRERPGFGEAMVQAYDRLLAGDAKPQYKQLAAQTKLRTLHAMACRGDGEAEKQLAAAVEQFSEDGRKAIAEDVRFLKLEQRALAVDNLPLEQVPAMLDELQKFFAQQVPTARHLRLASATVHAINRLENGDERERWFGEFGRMFAKSDDRQLASYGRKLAKDSGPSLEQLVGKPLELEGVTTLGVPLDWASYRGKVVLVDFWATWCDPCRKELPHLVKYYEALHDRGLDVLGLSMDEDLGVLGRFLEENEIPWTVLVGEQTQQTAEKLGVRGIPTLLLVDRQGKVVAVEHSLEKIRPKVEELLEQQ